MQEVKSLVNISKYAGERFDLVQAGGGNSSVKFDDGTMIIKASGISLSEVEEQSGYSKVFTQDIANIVHDSDILNAETKRERENLTAPLVKKATLDTRFRPSIETLLHSFLLKYTLHTHPIVVNKVVSNKAYTTILKKIFPDDLYVTVEYETPGIELALKLHGVLGQSQDEVKIIFLQNHGLIISANSEEEIYKLTDYVVEKIETFYGLDFSSYRAVTKLSSLMNQLSGEKLISYFSRDYELVNILTKRDKTLFDKTPFCPDTLVYCGSKVVFLNSLEDEAALIEYKKNFYELPKVVVCDENVYIFAKNVKKAKEIEEVLKFHFMVLSDRDDDVNLLSMDELSYLSNWEAEKYRQNI